MLHRSVLPEFVARLSRVIAVGSLLAGLTGVALAQAPDPVQGRETARQWCVGCHVISGSQSRGTDVGPAFDQIAAKPQWLQESALFEFLSRPHRTMPNFTPSHRDVIDLIAFLKTQGR